MANHQSSEKRIRQTEKRRLHNRYYANTSADPYGTAWDGAQGDGLDLTQRAGGVIAEGFGYVG